MQPWKPDFDISGLGKELYIVGLTPPVNKKKDIYFWPLKKISYYIIGMLKSLKREKLSITWVSFFVSEKSEWIIHHQSTFRVKNKWMMYYNTHYIAVAPGCKENEVKDDWKMFEIPTLLVYAYTMAVYVYTKY